MIEASIHNSLVTVYEGDALTTLRTLPDDSVDCCVTSPPYWGLRDYGHADQMGLEPSPFEYIHKMAGVFAEVRRVLKPTGTCWLVIGDSYAGGGASANLHDPRTKQGSNRGAESIPRSRVNNGSGSIKPKDLCGIPWRLAFALQDRGWFLRQDIIWAKPNPMPESVTDRCTRSHEYVFLLTKQARYYYDAEAISTPTSLPEGTVYTGGMARNGNHKFISSGNHKGPTPIANLRTNRRDVWTIQGEPYPEAHFATFPTKLVKLCINAGCPPDGVVLDPFGGCGTTGEVAVKLGRRAILVELNAQYVEMIRKNLGLFAVAL
jgi:DNA modification methylase